MLQADYDVQPFENRHTITSIHALIAIQLALTQRYGIEKDEEIYSVCETG